MRHFFVINPHSFSTKEELKKVTKEIPRHFMVTGSPYTIFTSRYPRDAIAVLHQYLTNIPPAETVRVYAVGGDGILFDCLNGIIDFPNAELSCVPYGNSNYFIRSLGKNAVQQCRDIPGLAKGLSFPADVIRCGSNYTLNPIAIGLEAQAIIDANEFLHNSNNKYIKPFVGAIYKISAVINMFNKEVTGQPYRIIIDRENCSGRYFNIDVNHNGGFMDMLFAKSDTMPALLMIMPRFFKRNVRDNERFYRRRGQSVSIVSDSPIRVHMDGEAYKTYKLQLELMKNKIKFFAPEGLVRNGHL